MARQRWYYFPKEKHMVVIQDDEVVSAVKFKQHPLTLWDRDIDTIQFICWR